MRLKRLRDAALLLVACSIPLAAVFGRSGEKKHSAEDLKVFEAAEEKKEEELWETLDKEIYPEELIDLVKRNPETYEFVASYPVEADKDHDLNLDSEVVPDKIPYLSQWDKRWGYDIYNGKYFALTGCGPTCLSMVSIYLTGDSYYTPRWMGEFLDSHGYAVPGTGTAWSIFDDGIVELGIYGTEIANDYNVIERSLNSGYPVIASMGPGDFTSDGHFVVFTACADNKISVNDPNSLKRTREWDYSELAPQIVKVWAMSMGDPESRGGYTEFEEYGDQYQDEDFEDEFYDESYDESYDYDIYEDIDVYGDYSDYGGEYGSEY